MSDIYKFDVIVVGAGVIGIAIAMTCANKKKSVLLIEKNSSFGEGSNLLPSNRTSLFVQVDYVPYYDTGQVVAKLRVTGDNFDIVEYITGQK